MDNYEENLNLGTDIVVVTVFVIGPADQPRPGGPGPRTHPAGLRMVQRLILVDATDGRRAFSCRFVYVDDCLYVAGHDLVSYMARHRLDQLSAYSEALTASGAHELIVVDDESELHGLLMQHFAEKYDASAGAFVELRPLILVRE